MFYLVYTHETHPCRLFTKLTAVSSDLTTYNCSFTSTSHSRSLFHVSEDLKTLVASLTKEKGPKGADLAFNEYSHTWGKKPTKEEIKRAVVEVETDYIFLVPTQAALYQHNSVAT